MRSTESVGSNNQRYGLENRQGSTDPLFWPTKAVKIVLDVNAPQGFTNRRIKHKGL
jgi:hypothetical protein